MDILDEPYCPHLERTRHHFKTFYRIPFHFMHGLFYTCLDCGGNGMQESSCFPKFLAPQGNNSSPSGKGALTSVHSLCMYTASENHTAGPERGFPCK